ncbi:MmcQ/YjbR family DNA-binding protein [Bacteroidetes/Chlorobi group bacterium Naka2016]|jgi:predicted DNA-binding protein (MmcQ/YjbR family)|nr:MAG: MmcQ/YjbR family DNA-binding protein [Bacteroidetes/Chlorobi group bacterium Naka2016]
MDLLQIREYCLSKPFAVEDFPFDDETLVFKVFGKMFALVDLYSIPAWMNLKVPTEDLVYLVERYAFIKPGYHMNKKYWITVQIVDNISDNFLMNLIDTSYNEVVKKLPKFRQKLIEESLKNG